LLSRLRRSLSRVSLTFASYYVVACPNRPPIRVAHCLFEGFIASSGSQDEIDGDRDLGGLPLKGKKVFEKKLIFSQFLYFFEKS
jgi:hypothetical protein